MKANNTVYFSSCTQKVVSKCVLGSSILPPGLTTHQESQDLAYGRAHGDDLLQQRTQGIISKERSVCSHVRGSHTSQAALGSHGMHIAPATSCHHMGECPSGRLTEPGSQHFMLSAPRVPGGNHMLPMLLMPGVRTAALHGLPQNPPCPLLHLVQPSSLSLVLGSRGCPRSALMFLLRGTRVLTASVWATSEVVFMAGLGVCAVCGQLRGVAWKGSTVLNVLPSSHVSPGPGFGVVPIITKSV